MVGRKVQHCLLHTKGSRSLAGTSINQQVPQPPVMPEQRIPARRAGQACRRCAGAQQQAEAQRIGPVATQHKQRKQR